MTIQQHVDGNGIMGAGEASSEPNERDRAMRVREAMLMWLRAFEDMHDLPRSIPTRLERAPRTSGGHNKG